MGRGLFSYPMATTIAVIVVYLAVIIPLLVIHETIPPAPDTPTVYRGLNLSEAWLDLDELSNGFHPFNSRRNDEVRNWLLKRIEEIVHSNGASFKGELAGTSSQLSSPDVTIFDDLESNYTASSVTSVEKDGRKLGVSTYFEGSNIIVYIRGSEDESGQWWNDDVAVEGSKTHGKGGVLVNAHFDSVSTGYGTTDDGMGVITVLQLIRYFTAKGNTPKKGVVALLNNGEEDGLYGAKAFVTHPMAKFAQSFLNLEGAGAGGRATLFRATDTEVTRGYGKAPNPLGTVITSDAFALGFIRSETDYVVFKAEGLRGLDVAFWEPRARYHTDQDDTKHASRESLWHMLSASVETMKYLTVDTGTNYDKSGSTGVYFDFFGQALAVFQLHTLFALSLTLLIVAPLILIGLIVILVKQDKFYFFTGSIKPDGPKDETVDVNGWRGLTRFPTVTIVSSALTIGAALLLRKINPLIIFSSPYSVWAMSLSLFFISFWFLMSGYDNVKPSALHRGYSLLHMHGIGWIFLVISTIGQDRYKISSGYIFLFYYGVVFLATVITLCELFAVRTKATFVQENCEEHEARDGFRAMPGPSVANNSSADNDNQAEDEEQYGTPPSENTPLIRGNKDGSKAPSLKTRLNPFKSNKRKPRNENMDGAQDDYSENLGQLFHHGEQAWSADLPTWTWLLQFLLIAPAVLIILGQVALLLVTATAQTGTDGSALLLPYLVVALFTILLLIPIGPFIHRVSVYLPLFLFLVFVGTLIYNLVAFPFSANNRYKAYFQQTVDLDTGVNKVTLVGLENYIRDIISDIPSAAGQSISCVDNPAIRSGLSYCSYEGIAPQVVKGVKHGVPPEKGYKKWLSFNTTREKGLNKARFTISAQETKACTLRFNEPFSRFYVHGGANDGKWSEVPETGSDQLKLWHRDWNREWVVDVEWPVGNDMNEGDEGRSGRVVCIWSDQNQPGNIPALEEAKRFSPAWTSITKLTDGLVEGSKAFNV